MLTPDFGQLDRRIAQEAGTLAAAGWQVDIYPTHDPRLTASGLVAGVQLLRNTSISRGPSPTRRALRGVKGLLRKTSRSLVAAAESIQYRVTDPAEETVRTNLQTLRYEGPYGLIFAHDIPVLPLGTELKRLWGSPLICDLHEVYPEQTEVFQPGARDYWRGIEETHLPQADAILCVNPAILEYVERAYGLGSKALVVYNSVPFVPRGSATADIRGIYPIPAEARVLLFVGSLLGHKNIAALIRGFGLANQPEWVLAIMGTGPDLGALRGLIGELGLAGRVYIGASVDQDQLISVAASTHAGVVPYLPISFNYRIATPNKLFEYIQARLPIASSRLDMIERLIGGAELDGEAIGGFVDFSTPMSTAEGLKAFVSSVLPTISADALERAAERFCWEVDGAGVLAVVEALAPQAAA